jgi:3',5'-cyclic AMP phosphodiesterase CpdA
MKLVSSIAPVLTAGLVLVGVFAMAHESPEHDWKPEPFAETLAHAPTPLPDRIVLTWAGDPATTQAVTWRTDTSVQRGLAQLAVAVENSGLKPTSFVARTEDFTSDLGEAHYHSIQFTNLEPDMLYAYRVGDGANWSEWFHFHTAKNGPAPFTFVYFGDAQNDIKTHWSRVFREAFRDAPRAAFTLHAGDLINRQNHDAEWGEWFAAPAWVNATIPVFPTPGNHEYFNEGASPADQRRWTRKGGEPLDVTLVSTMDKTTKIRRVFATAADGREGMVTLDAQGLVLSVDAGFSALVGWSVAEVVGIQPDKKPLDDRPQNLGVRTVSRHWRPQFTLPTDQGAPAGLEETCYYVDYQGARIVSLDSNRLQAEQVTWLRSVLSRNPQRWTILTFHHPMFSPASSRDNPELRRMWKPVLDEFKVDLVLTGHDHTYARTGDVSAKSVNVGTTNVSAGYNQAYDPAIGTVYVVSVSGPKMYGISNDAFAVRAGEDLQLYQIITVDGDTLRYEARTAVNRLYDAFTLEKRDGQANRLVESLGPESRRAKAAGQKK